MTYRAVSVYIQVFLTSALVGGEWPASRPCRFNPEERACGMHRIGGCVSPREDLGNMGKFKILTLLGLKFHLLCRPTRSQSLYRRHNCGSYYCQMCHGTKRSFTVLVCCLKHLWGNITPRANNLTEEESFVIMRHPLRQSWRMPPSGMVHRVALVRTDVSEECIASIITVTTIGELGTTLAVTNNQSTLLMEAIRSPETSVLTRTIHHIPEDLHSSLSLP
jgi:hypothetical protein